MATTNNVYVNVKELPEVAQINNGDYILVETPDGTSIIDFQNFIIGPDNSGLTSVVESNASSIYGVSATAESNLQSLSTEIYANIKRVYYGKAQISIETGTQGIALLSPKPTEDVGEILPEDIIIVPANSEAAKYPAFATYVDNTDEARGLVYIAGYFTKTVYYLQGTLPVPISNAGTNVINSQVTLDHYTAGQLIDNIVGTAILNSDVNNPLKINSTTTNETAESLGIAPVYNIIVCKPY